MSFELSVFASLTLGNKLFRSTLIKLKTENSLLRTYERSEYETRKL